MCLNSDVIVQKPTVVRIDVKSQLVVFGYEITQFICFAVGSVKICLSGQPYSSCKNICQNYCSF